MTLLLVFRATDGLLVLADGRRRRISESLEQIVLDDTARKSVIAPGSNAVIMAAGGTKFGDRFAADVFEAALADAQHDGEQQRVAAVAETCFRALKVANKQHHDEERTVWMVVAGFDESQQGPQVFEAVVAAGGALPPREVDLAGGSPIYAVPEFLNESVGHLVRERFGYVPQKSSTA